MSPDGICLVKKGYYTGMIWFSDANYRILDERERRGMLEAYSRIINSFTPEMDVQIFLFSRRCDRTSTEEKLDIPLQGDQHDFLRKEYMELLKNLYSGSTSGITKDRYMILGIKAKKLNEARKIITDKAKLVIDGLQGLKSEARLLDGTERMRVMYEFFNQDKPQGFRFSYENAVKTGDDFKDYIAPESIDFSKAGIVKMDNLYVSTRYLVLDCAKATEDLMESLAKIDECFSVTMHLQTIEPGEALKMARDALIKAQSSKINQQKQAFDTGYDSDLVSSTVLEEERNATEILRNLNESNQKLIRTVFLITAFGKTRRELTDIHEKVFFKFSGTGCRYYSLKYAQEQALNAAAPIGICEVKPPRIMLTNNVGIFAPFNTWELFQDGDCIYYGINSLSRNLILGDRKQLDNPNGLIIGVPGSGKSFAAKREILATYTVTKDDIIICDPEGEYAPIVTGLEGTVVKLATNSKDYLNPLDINYDSRFYREELKTKSDFVLTLCECMVGDKFGLESDERGIIDSCLWEIYEDFFNDPKPENMPILEDLYNALVNYTPDYAVYEELKISVKKKALNLANRLVLYVHGSQNYFNHRTNVDSTNRVICFDIRDLKSQLKDVAMLVVQDAVWNRVSRNRDDSVRTRYYVDEFHLLLREARTAEYCAEIWKRFRKWGGMPTGITQNIRDLRQTEKAQTILSTSDYIYILKQSANDAELLKERLGLNDTELECVLNAKRGSGIMRFGTMKLQFEDDYPRNTRSYALMNTKPAEEEKDEGKR